MDRGTDIMMTERDDYIRRQAAIDKLASIIKFEAYDNSKKIAEYPAKQAAKEFFSNVPSADVVEADKAQKEIDYWHDKAQSYEQTILKLSLNKAEQPENCEGCKHLGKWENEVKYGYPSFEILSPCTRCKRRAEDHYER